MGMRCEAGPARAPLACRLVLAAHMDDETLGLGAQIAAWTATGASVHVAFLTQGEPQDRRFYAAGADIHSYAARRRTEALLAAHALGLPSRNLHFADFPDLELSLHLDAAWEWLHRLSGRLRPRFIYAPAYEGGHPDHDALNLLASHLQASSTKISAWEYPLYTQCRGRVLYSSFPNRLGPVRILRPEASFRRRKCRALSCYISQRSTLQYFPMTEEKIRRLPRHDFKRPAVEPTVYELWGWPWRGSEFCAIWSRFQPADGQLP